VIGNVLHGVVPRASEAVPALSPAVDVLFARVFDRDLDSRFRTALQFSEAIVPLARAKSPLGTEAVTPPAAPRAPDPGGAGSGSDTRPRRWAGFSDPSRPDQPTPSQPLSRPILAAAGVTSTPAHGIPLDPGSRVSTPALLVASPPHAIVAPAAPRALAPPADATEVPRPERRPASLVIASVFALLSVLTLLVALALTRR
jgi:hypothetical protein